MGRTYLFECFRCGYRARVSGGAGVGQHFAVQTIVCADCKELYDAVTEFKATAPPVAERQPQNRSRVCRGVKPAAAPWRATTAEIQARLSRLAVASGPGLEPDG